LYDLYNAWILTIHAGEKLYTCDIWKISTSYAYILSRHIFNIILYLLYLMYYKKKKFCNMMMMMCVLIKLRLKNIFNIIYCFSYPKVSIYIMQHGKAQEKNWSRNNGW